MALSPQTIRETTFKAAKRGYDQHEVNAFVEEVAATVEAAQNEATAMEARARAAVARLQELSQQSAEAPPADAGKGVDVKVDEAETISRTLLLAQRTADTTVAEAQAEADRLLAAARDEASAGLDGARAESERLIEEAKADARRAGESERVRVEGEVQALLARRDFLEADVDHLEQYLVAQRERITEAVASLQDLVSRVPDGLADMRRPLMSAAAEPPAAPDEGADEDPFAVADAELAEEAGTDTAGGLDEHSEITEITRVATSSEERPGGRVATSSEERPGGRVATSSEERPGGRVATSSEERPGDRVATSSDDRSADATPPGSGRPLFDEDGEPTAQLGAVNPRER